MTNAIRRYLAWRLGWLLIRLDELSHRTRYGADWLCLAADVTYGWGPDAEDWERSANRFHRWLNRELTRGQP